MKRKISKWTEEEENMLKTLKEQQGIGSWAQIAKKVTQAYPSKQRNGKQCRERYINFTVFMKNQTFREEWQESQCLILYEKYLEYGCQWKKISESLPNRSQNCVKNKFYIELRKFIAKLNKICQKKTQAKLSSIKRLFDLLEIQNQMKMVQQRLNQYKNLKHKILKYSLLKCDMGLQESQNISLALIKFNSQTRFMNNGRKINKLKRMKSRQTKINMESSQNSIDCQQESIMEQHYEVNINPFYDEELFTISKELEQCPQQIVQFSGFIHYDYSQQKIFQVLN